MPTPTTFAGLVGLITKFIGLLVPAIFAVLFVYLMWKVIDAWVLNAGDQTKREEGKNYVTAAVIVFVIMISVWGIVAMLQSSFLSP